MIAEKGGCSVLDKESESFIDLCLFRLAKFVVGLFKAL
jgi:hypothetical protein